MPDSYRLRSRHYETEGWNPRENPLASRRFTEKCSGGDRIAGDHMVAVIREMIAGINSWGMAHNPIPLHNRGISPRFLNHPFSAPNRHCNRRKIVDRDEIDKRVGLVLWCVQTRHVKHIVHSRLETRPFTQCRRHGAKHPLPSPCVPSSI